MPTGIQPTPRWPQVVALVLGGAGFFGALASFSAWALDVPRLADWLDRGIAIQPNSALGLGLAALGLVAAALRHRITAILFGVAVTVVGGATLLEWLTATAPGFDLWLTFGREWGRGGTVFVGRMGIPACVSLTLKSSASWPCCFAFSSSADISAFVKLPPSSGIGTRTPVCFSMALALRRITSRTAPSTGLFSP